MAYKKITARGGLHSFRVHLPNLLHEIADAGLTTHAGVLAKPLQISQRYLISLTQRAIELRDPVLDKIMCDLALYSFADPTSPDFDQEAVDRIQEIYQEHKEKESQ